MAMETIKNKWIGFVNRMNRMGVPIPTVRDPKTGRGSITAALVVFSAGLFALCILFMLATAVGKWAGFFILTDTSFAQVRTAADYSWQFLMTAIGAYLGRFWQKGGKEEDYNGDRRDDRDEPSRRPSKPTRSDQRDSGQRADDPDQQ